MGGVTLSVSLLCGHRGRRSFLLTSTYLEDYLRPPQKMENFATLIVVKFSVLDICGGPVLTLCNISQEKLGYLTLFTK